MRHKVRCTCSKSLQSCLTLRDPMDCSLPGFSNPRDSPGKILDWVAGSPPGGLPHLGIEPTSLISPALAGGFFTTRATWEAQMMRYREPDPEGSRAQGLLSQWSLRCANLLACGGILAHPLGSSLNLYRRDFCDDSIMQARLMKSLATGE